MLKMCINPKVIALLAAVGVGVFLIAPGLIAAALPLLILAVCPLSMLLMGRAMMGRQAAETGASPSPSPQPGVSERATEEVKALKAQVQSMSEQQAALRAEIERLTSHAPTGSSKGIVDEAAAVARAASDKRTT